MFTSCGMAGFQSQYQVQALVGPHSGLDVNSPVQMELGVTPQMCPPFQGQAYSGHPSSSTTISFSSVSATPPMTQIPMLPPPPLPPAALKLGQGGFKKVCRTEDDVPCPFPGLAAGVLEMRVKEGSKIRNLMGFAMARMQGERGDAAGGGASNRGGCDSGLRQVVFTGSGRAVTKTITCVEIMKRKVGGLHQLTKLRYKSVKEVWESQEGGGSASEMTVHRTVPSISILLSKDHLDPQEPGYQPPESLSAFWEEREEVREGSTLAASKRPLGPAPQTSYPDSKRACQGEGSILTSR